jgi:hypothetical protein
MDPEPEYCPFCGARLADTTTAEGEGDDGDPLLAHLQDREECRDRYEAWNPGRTTVEIAGTRRQSTFGRILMWTLIGLAIAYSLLVVQQPLVGVSVAILIYIVFNIEID